jgi:hypothetical protein
VISTFSVIGSDSLVSPRKCARLAPVSILDKTLGGGNQLILGKQAGPGAKSAEL